jgi:hypothetical protein
MMTPPTDTHVAPTTGRLWTLWGLPIGAWGAHLFISYGFVEWYCQHQQEISPTMAKLILHGLTLIMLMVAATGGYLAWRTRARLKRVGARDSQGRQPGPFMLNSGVLLALLMTLIILVTGSANLVMPVCIE